jgi:hypothetical protein
MSLESELTARSIGVAFGLHAFDTHQAEKDSEPNMSGRPFKPGDLVVFQRRKYTTHPGRRAQDVEATPHGDLYSYYVEKSWIVQEVQPDGKLLLKTRRGKSHAVEPNDPNLRHASWWDKFRYRKRFAELRGLTGSSDG